MPAIKESVLLARFQEAQPMFRKGSDKPMPKALDIIDIRGQRVEINLKDEVIAMMNPDDGPRTLPTLLLYNERGLQLFEDITYLDEYYLTNCEIELLKKSSAEMARKVPEGAMLVELGSGNLRKVCLLLQAFEDLGKRIDYFALDLSQAELERTLAAVPDFEYVSCHGLRGTYDDGREWLKQPLILERPKCILHLGSSIGNFHRDDAAEFMRSFAEVLQPADLMVVGVDSCKDPDKIYHAYNDKQGITHQFVLNGLAHANEILGEEVFHVEDWKVIGEYIYDEDGGRHQAFVSPTQETSVFGIVIPPHERIKIEQSLKYSRTGVDKLWKMAGLNEIGYWSRDGEYGIHVLEKAKLPFNRLPSLYAAGTLPAWQDWENLWEAWGIVTRKMLPDAELNEKPIKLRNACIFYLGHIPAFLDIQLTRTTKASATSPAYYHTIFERGIDPDVDNPEHCHAHSEIPNEWPLVKEILTYQDRVRERLLQLYSNPNGIKGDVRRAVWLGFEHEVMHLETLLYMLLQSDKTLPPPNTVQPDFAKLAQKAYEARVPNEWFDIPEQTIAIGMDDPEDEYDSNRHFGWDNEKPARKENVHAFQAKARPITNEEYAKYLYSAKIDQIPASWSNITHSNGTSKNGTSTNGTNGHHTTASLNLPDSYLQGKAVRTVYGLVPLKYALDWPVFASYDELASCASWMGGRIPTAEEAKSIYAYVEKQKEISTQSKLSNKVPAVNGHLVNDGVEETPPPHPPTQADDSSKLFIDLTLSNVGFKHWHPVAVTSQGNRISGQADMGGVWEWTSSVLRPHAGFHPMALYPAYTADFFDEKHNIVLGGSWATHPRVAGRKSFVNWYQRNYPYAWVGARLVRDMQ